MRIFQVVTAFQYRGAEIAALQLARELAASGHEVFYVSLYPSQDNFRISPGIYAECLGGKRGVMLDLAMLLRLVRVLREFSPDVIQANAGDTLKYTVFANFFFRRQFKVVFRNASTVSRYLRSLPQRLFNGFLYSRVDRVLSVSHDSMRDLLSVFPRLKDRIQVIPNGVVVDSVLRPPRGQTIASVVHVGGFTFEKNHIGLVRIFRRVLERVPNARLTLIGQGPLKQQIQAEITSAGIDDKVQFVGATSDPLRFIAAADVLVLPSVIEGLPGVILEAFLCKTAVVAFDVGGISEIVRNDDTGWLVKAGDEVAFSEAVIIALRTVNEKMLGNAYELVVDEYNMKKLAQQTLQEYELLMANPAHRINL